MADTQQSLPPGFAIRPATPSDLSAIVAMRDALNDLERAGCPHAPIQRLTVEQFTELWGKSFDDPNHCWRLVEQEGKPIGFGLIYLLPRSRPTGAFIHWAYLDPAHRRQGLGAYLLEHLLNWARERGAQHVELQFIAGNDIAERFWTKMGFQTYARKCVYDLHRPP